MVTSGVPLEYEWCTNGTRWCTINEVICMGRTSYIATRKYREKAYDQINVIVTKGRKKDITEYAMSIGKTVNGLISDLLQEQMQITSEEWKKKDAC